MISIEKLKARESYNIPVLDFSRLFNPAERSFICEQMAHACETVGLFQIVNTGIPQNVLDDAFERSRDFFELPLEEKLILRQDRTTKSAQEPSIQLGYRPFPGLNSNNRLEGMAFRNFHYQLQEYSYTPVSSPTTGEMDWMKNSWPTNPPHYRTMLERLLGEFDKVCNTLLDLFSESLGLPTTFLREEQNKNVTVSCYMTSLRYPKGTTANNESRLSPHRDSSIFSVVAQGFDVEGLEINPHGEWIPIYPQREALIINVGDTLQAWSNGRFKSILHRVMSNKESERYSFAYFLFPVSFLEEDLIVEPIPKLISQDNPAKYVPFSYLEFFKDKKFVDKVDSLKSREVKCSAWPDTVPE